MAWVVSPSVVWLGAGDDVQVYDTIAGEFQTFNNTAAAIWRHLSSLGEADLVVAALAEEFGAVGDHQRRIIAADTAEFIDDLASRGLICARQNADA